MGLRGLEIGNAVGERQLDDPIFEPFFDVAQALDGESAQTAFSVTPWTGGLTQHHPDEMQTGEVSMAPAPSDASRASVPAAPSRPPEEPAAPSACAPGVAAGSTP